MRKKAVEATPLFATPFTRTVYVWTCPKCREEHEIMYHDGDAALTCRNCGAVVHVGQCSEAESEPSWDG